jgi:hypothetical protein
MTGFLDRLAGFATGSPVAGVARIALPSRFAPVSSAVFPKRDIDETDRTSIAAKAIEQGRPVRAGESAAHESAPVRLPEVSKDSPRQTAHIAARLDASPAFPERRSSPNEPHPPFGKQRPAASSMLTPARDRAADSKGSAAQAFTRLAPENPLRIETPVRGTAVPVREASLANAAPLNPDVLSHRPQAAHNTTPPVYVTIDRIDVRVAPVAKTVPQARTRRPASQSLSEYLRGPERGGRS